MRNKYRIKNTTALNYYVNGWLCNNKKAVSLSLSKAGCIRKRLAFEFNPASTSSA